MTTILDQEPGTLLPKTPPTQDELPYEESFIETGPLPEMPPTQDELPHTDGESMESQRHLFQMDLLIDPVRNHWKDREQGFVGGNMFVYFSLKHLKNEKFRGPDFFAVVDAPKGERKSWVVWEESRGPDVVVELLSESTAEADKGEKKKSYQDELRVPEYFWFDPFSKELAGFRLQGGVYQPIQPDAEGRLYSEKLKLFLVRVKCVYKGLEIRWLRWMTPEGQLLPTGEEQAAQAQQQAAQAQQQAAQAQQQAAQAQQQAAQAQQQADEERHLRQQAEERILQLEAMLRAASSKPAGAEGA